MQDNTLISTKDILDKFYQNVNDRDGSAIIDLLSDKIDWYIVESEILPWTGRLEEKGAIKKALTMLFDAHLVGEDELEPDHIFIDGEEAAVFGKISRTIKSTGNRFTTIFCHRITVKEGKILKFQMFEDTPEVEKAFRIK